MSKFKDKIRAAGGKIEFFYNPANGGIATQISGFGFIAVYQVAVSMDGRVLLGTIPATGIGVGAVYPRPKDFSSSQAWFATVHCNDLEISEFPEGGCPVRLRVLKRYGDAVQLGEITTWEDRLQPAATPTFPEGDVVHHATYHKTGSSEKRGLYIHASKDGANSFLLKASTGERLTGDDKDISKKFMAMQIDYLSAGFTRDGFGGSGGSNLHKLFVS
jgi:hypothetical protein